MWLNYPHMPTGTDVSLATFDRLIGWAKERDILLVNDNPYSFVLTEKPQSLLSRPGAKDVAVELNSLSKSFNMAGWRVGMLSGKADVLQQTLKVKSNMDSGVIFKAAIAPCCTPKNIPESILLLTLSVYKKRSALMRVLAQKLGASVVSNSVGLFLWAKLPEDAPDAETFINTVLHQNNIFITPGIIFGSQGEGYIRFSLCVPEATIEEAIKRIEL